MNRVAFVALAATLAVVSFGCNRKSAAPAEIPAGRPLALESTVRTGDPAVEKQLVSGFHAIENGSWRWTQRKFEVELATPPGAAAKGGLLECNFSIPAVSIQKLKSQNLTASIAGTPLKPATLDAAGLFTYSREIAPNLITGPSVKVSFELDKALPTDGVDARELGVVASSFSLKSR